MLCDFPPRLTVQRVGTKGQSLAMQLEGCKETAHCWPQPT